MTVLEIVVALLAAAIICTAEGVSSLIVVLLAVGAFVVVLLANRGAGIGRRGL